MSVIIDPDFLDRFDTLYNPDAQKISVYPVGSTQRNSSQVYLNAWVGTTGILRKTASWAGGVTAGDVVCVMNSTDAGHYYVNTISTTDLTLADIDTGTNGAPITTLTVNEHIFDGSNATVVVVATDQITITAHGYVDGDQIVYDNGGGTDITGLVSGTLYFIIRVDANTVKLATTRANALAGTAIDITALGTGTTHAIRDRIVVAVFTNGANANEIIGASLPTGGDGTGTPIDGISMQTIYSFSKEEWKDDSIKANQLSGNYNSSDYFDDLARYEFPIEAITSEQFEIGGGAAHKNWTWFNDYTRKKVRTGGWADKTSTSSNDKERWTGIITLGSLDSDTQVYYQQLNVTNLKTDFTFLGVVNEPIRIWLDTNQDGTADALEDKTTFLKLFARKKARTYAGSQISDIGVSTIQTIVNRFPLAHSTDAAIVQSDGAVLGKAPWKNIFTLVSGTDGSVTQSDSTRTFTSATANFIEQHNVAAVINAGGSGFISGDVGAILSIDGTGATSSTATTLKITAVSGGAITGLSINDPGSYSVLPTTLIGNTLSGGTGSGATVDLKYHLINKGDTLTISAGSTNGVLNKSYTVEDAPTATTITLSVDADLLSTGWSQSDTGLTYAVNSTVIAGDTATQSTIAQDYTTAGASNGIIDVIPASVPAGALGSITDTTGAHFLGVNSGDFVKITGSTGGTVKGIFKVVDSTYDANASAPTSTILFLNTSDGSLPATLDGSATYTVVKPGMYLQFKDLSITNTAPASYNISRTNNQITRSDGTWDTAIAAGSILTITSATDASNNGKFTVKARTSSTILTMVSITNGDRFGIDNAADTTAVVAVSNGFFRAIGSETFGFNWRLTGNGGSLSEAFEFIQHQMRQPTEIDQGLSNKIGNVNDLLMSFSTPTGTGLNMFIDNLAATDINNATFQDTASLNRNFPFTSSGNLIFNKNLSDDSTSKYWLYFTNDSAGDNLGKNYGTENAILVNDASSPPVSILGNINGAGNHTGVAVTPDAAGNISIPFTFDYDGNVQRGLTSASTDAPVSLVAIGLSNAQFVITTGTISRATGISISSSSALERNYSNPV